MSERAVRLLALLAAALLCAGLFPRPQRPAPQRYAAEKEPAGTEAPALPRGEIDPNTADLEELTGLYGVGEHLAAAILAEREANGPFHYPEDLLAVRGIGAKTLAGFIGQLDFGE